MITEKHELAHELPEFKDKIHDLKVSDAHFKKIFDEYHALTKEIHNLESNDVPVTDEHFEDLKKQRLGHKDELFKMLKAS